MRMGQGVKTGLGHGGITCVLQTQFSSFFFFFFSFLIFIYFWSSLVRNGLNAGWFLVNSHYKRLCASLCTFENVQKIKVG